MNLVQRFRDAYGKSQQGLTYDGPLTLHDHVIDATRVAAHILERSQQPEYDRRRADTLIALMFFFLFPDFFGDAGLPDAS